MHIADKTGIVIRTSQVPGTVVFSNYREVKARLKSNLAFYDGVVYDSIEEAEVDKRALSLILRS